MPPFFIEANIASLRHKVTQHHFGAQRRTIISRHRRRHHFWQFSSMGQLSFPHPITKSEEAVTAASSFL